MLREKLGVSQRVLAEKLGTATETVSRWEAGRRAPTRRALKKLSDIAESAGLDSLRTFFEGQRKSGIAAGIKSLPSSGTQRRVAVDDLAIWEYWAEIISRIARVLLGQLGDKLDQQQRGDLRAVRDVATCLRYEVYLHKGGAPKRSLLPEATEAERSALNRAFAYKTAKRKRLDDPRLSEEALRKIRRQHEDAAVRTRTNV
jgi:transcriptional regulator with XRE-family HTH domain